MPNPSFYWDGSFIYGYYQWEEKWENGDDAKDWWETELQGKYYYVLK